MNTTGHVTESTQNGDEQSSGSFPLVQDMHSLVSGNTSSKPNVFHVLDSTTTAQQKCDNTSTASSSLGSSVYYSPFQDTPTLYDIKPSPPPFHKYLQLSQHYKAKSDGDARSEDDGEHRRKDKTPQEVVVINVDENREASYNFPPANTKPILSYRPLLHTKAGENGKFRNLFFKLINCIY